MSPSLGHTPSLEASTVVKVMGRTVVSLAEDIDSTPVASAVRRHDALKALWPKERGVLFEPQDKTKSLRGEGTH